SLRSAKGTSARFFESGSPTTIAAGHTRAWDQVFQTGRSMTQLAAQQVIGSQSVIGSSRRQSSAGCITNTALSDRPRELRASVISADQTTPGYMRLLKASVLNVWSERKAAVQGELADVERKVKTIRQKLDRLERGFYLRSRDRHGNVRTA